MQTMARKAPEEVARGAREPSVMRLVRFRLEVLWIPYDDRRTVYGPVA